MKKSLITVGIVLAFIAVAVEGYYLYKNINSIESSISKVATSDKISTPKDFKVAFFGDQGITEESRKVLELVKSEGTDMVLHVGDFDYLDDPKQWEVMVNNVLGVDTPYFGLVGNHDLKEWDGYQEVLERKLKDIEGANCEGRLGVKTICTYKGLRFVLSGVGTLELDHEKFIKDSLASSDDYIWEVCAWHKNMKLMQTGGKKDEVGWTAYDICREEGAFIATGHEHSYSRTHLMSDFENQKVASTSDTVEITKGKVFAFVSGIAGYGIRDQKEELAINPWWASVYTNQQNAKPGALFCEFNKGGVKNKAACYFKNIDNNIVDKFTLIKK